MGIFSLTQELAIDLGTANTLIMHNGKVVVDEPSIVALSIKTGDLMAIGHKARLMDGNGNAILVAGSVYSACRYYEIFHAKGFKKCAIISSYTPQAGDLRTDTVSDDEETETFEKYNTYLKMIGVDPKADNSQIAGKVAEFEKEANSLFGSGYVWLSINYVGTCIIHTSKDANNPIQTYWKPILCLDLWEHSYYIDYRNDRKRYIENFWNNIDWNTIYERYVYFCQ